MLNYNNIIGFVQSIHILKQLMKENIITYLRTQDMTYLENALKNIEEILELDLLIISYYNNNIRNI